MRIKTQVVVIFNNEGIPMALTRQEKSSRHVLTPYMHYIYMWDSNIRTQGANSCLMLYVEEPYPWV